MGILSLSSLWIPLARYALFVLVAYFLYLSLWIPLARTLSFSGPEVALTQPAYCVFHAQSLMCKSWSLFEPFTMSQPLPRPLGSALL